MNRQEFAKGIKTLELGYNTKFDKEKLDFWFRQLEDMKAEEYFDNLRELMRTSEYIPNIAQIRGDYKKTNYQNYEQRKYIGVDFDSLYAN